MKDLGPLDARSVVSNEDDERSICTSATTASLASRIQSLAVDFGPKYRQRQYDQFAEDEEEEEVISISEEDLLKELERQEPAFQICSRLFKQPSSRPLELKHLDLERAESFRSVGYAVVDNFISREYAGRLRAEAMLLNHQGQMRYASDLHRDRATDDTARGDKICWLHPSSMGNESFFEPLFTAIKELEEDLFKLMHLNQTKTEIQLGYYPPNGAQYVRHRDAFPSQVDDQDQRRVTAILYLNPAWRREDGGKLRLWLPPAEVPHESASQNEPTSYSTQPDSPVPRYPAGNTGPASSAPSRQSSDPTNAAPDTQYQPNGRIDLNGQANGHSNEHVNGHMNGDGRPLGASDTTESEERYRGSGSLSDFALGRNSNATLRSSESQELRRGPSANSFVNGQAHGPSPDHRQGNGAANGIAPQDLNDIASTHTPEGGRDLIFEHTTNLAARMQSPGSLNGSLVVEPTEASSAHDNASIDGGSVRSYHHTRNKAAEDVEVGTAAAMDVAPIAGRLVIFLSGAIEHAVLPNFSDRLAVTFWMQ